MRYSPELMDESSQAAIIGAVEQLYTSQLSDAWPAAYDVQKRTGTPIPVKEIDIVVLPLDRIGAPAGASRAKVFVAYYSHRRGPPDKQMLASPPLVMKIGSHDLLQSEFDAKNSWPLLSPDVRAHFAMPIYLHDHAGIWVLIAPFRSHFHPHADGLGHGIVLSDLWKLLHQREELRPGTSLNWRAVARCVRQALESIGHVHRDNNAKFSRRTSTYLDAYDRYLRYTHDARPDPPGRSHVPQHLFGVDPMVTAFGRQWPNPSHVVKSLIDSAVVFEGTFGPVHGDLHPKNIVLGYGDAMTIIDFGWARSGMHVVVDYLLLDINIRGTTLPSQIAERDLVAMADFLDPSQDPGALHALLQPRARLIKEEIWARCDQVVVSDWRAEYLVPFFLVAYGLLVHLDDARNQPALIAAVLAAAERIGPRRI